MLLRVARTLTGSSSDAEDLVQETLIRAWRSVERFDGRHPRAWLFTILRNTNINLHRRQRPSVVADPAILSHGRPAFNATPPAEPEDEALKPYLPDVLDRAVNALDVRFRTVLLLVDVDQLTYAEAAEVLHVPVGTIMSRLSRARDRVRAYVHDHEADQDRAPEPSPARADPGRPAATRSDRFRTSLSRPSPSARRAEPRRARDRADRYPIAPITPTEGDPS